MNLEDFRRNPGMRRWSTSYTKRVGKALLDIRAFVLLFKGNDKPIMDALELMRGYWTDLHVPYEERDTARAELEKVRVELAMALASNATLRNDLELAKTSRNLWHRLHTARGERMLAMQSAYRKLYERLHGKPHPIYTKPANIRFPAARLPTDYGRARTQSGGSANFGKTRSWSGGPANLQNLPRVAQQSTFRCNHWPLATSNMLGGRTTCEHGCHTVPLERWHNGTHQAPGLTNNQNYSRG